MTRRMADSISLASLPAGFDMYGGYDDGHWPDAAAIAAKFPGKTVIRFTVSASDNEGDCLDVESGDATPAQAPGWVERRRQAGHGGPLVYCSWSLLPAVKTAFIQAGVVEPGWFVAGYPSPDGDAIPAGCVGHQWIDRGPYDESIVVDYLPGIDPAPKPTPPAPTPKVQEDEMITPSLIAFGGSDHQFQRNTSGAIWHFWRGTGSAEWHSEGLPLDGGFVGNVVVRVENGELVVECEQGASNESLMVNTQSAGKPWSGWTAKA